MPEAPDVIGNIALAMLVLLLILSLSYAIITMLASRRRMQQPKPRIVTKVVCEKGDYEEVRDVQEGDYVGKIVGKCPKCGSNLIIESIYMEKSEAMTPKSY